MAWIGWQVGMTGAPVKVAKRKLKPRFSYAKALDDTEFFGPDLELVLVEFQIRTNDQRAKANDPRRLRVDGVLDYATQDALGMVPPKVKPVIFTVAGTGAGWDFGPPADLARAVADLFEWQGVGYPAKAIPMGKSIAEGRRELLNLLRNKHAGKKYVLVGYSQGATVVSLVWKYDLTDEEKSRCLGVITWGNPNREKGVANGNRFIGEPIPDGQGITRDNLVNTPANWYDFAHGANGPWGRDIYTDTPADTTAGEDMHAIWKIIEGFDLLGEDGLLEQITEKLGGNPLEWIGMFRAIYYAGAFFVRNPPTLPHINYDINPAIAIVRRLAA